VASEKICVVVVSGTRERLQMAAMVASVAAVSGIEVTVFLSMNAVPYFIKGASTDAPGEGGIADLMVKKKAPDFKTLFPDPHAEGVRFYNKTGIYPINHGMVIKREIVEKHPWVALNIYKAFERANEIAEAQRREAVEYHLEVGLLAPEARAALATPVLHHGIRRNRKVLAAAAQYSCEQGLTPRVMNLEELFAPSTMEQ